MGNSKSAPFKPLFGLDLEATVNRDRRLMESARPPGSRRPSPDDVPILVVDLVEFIRATWGPETPADFLGVDASRLHFDTIGKCIAKVEALGARAAAPHAVASVLTQAGAGVHDAGYVLRKFLLDLPEGLVPLSAQRRFLAAFERPEAESLRAAAASLDTLMPPHRPTLLFLLKLYHEMAGRCPTDVALSALITTLVPLTFRPVDGVSLDTQARALRLCIRWAGHLPPGTIGRPLTLPSDARAAVSPTLGPSRRLIPPPRIPVTVENHPAPVLRAVPLPTARDVPAIALTSEGTSALPDHTTAETELSLVSNPLDRPQAPSPILVVPTSDARTPPPLTVSIANPRPPSPPLSADPPCPDRHTSAPPTPPPAVASNGGATVNPHPILSNPLPHPSRLPLRNPVPEAPHTQDPGPPTDVIPDFEMEEGIQAPHTPAATQPDRRPLTSAPTRVVKKSEEAEQVDRPTRPSVPAIPDHERVASRPVSPAAPITSHIPEISVPLCNASSVSSPSTSPSSLSRSQRNELRREDAVDRAAAPDHLSRSSQGPLPQPGLPDQLLQEIQNCESFAGHLRELERSSLGASSGVNGEIVDLGARIDPRRSFAASAPSTVHGSLRDSRNPVRWDQPRSSPVIPSESLAPILADLRHAWDTDLEHLRDSIQDNTARHVENAAHDLEAKWRADLEDARREWQAERSADRQAAEAEMARLHAEVSGNSREAPPPPAQDLGPLTAAVGGLLGQLPTLQSHLGMTQQRVQELEERTTLLASHMVSVTDRLEPRLAELANVRREVDDLRRRWAPSPFPAPSPAAHASYYGLSASRPPPSVGEFRTFASAVPRDLFDPVEKRSGLWPPGTRLPAPDPLADLLVGYPSHIAYTTPRETPTRDPCESWTRPLPRSLEDEIALLRQKIAAV